MIKHLAVALVVATCAIGTAQAADKAARRTLTPQQQRMSDCAHKSKHDGLKGDARKAFMKKCLSKAGHDKAMGKAGHDKAMGKGEHGEK